MLHARKMPSKVDDPHPTYLLSGEKRAAGKHGPGTPNQHGENAKLDCGRHDVLVQGRISW